jgi:hypothetical protein
MAIIDIVKHKVFGIVVAGIILGYSFLSGCSMNSPSTASMQTEIFNILQTHPQIEGMTYMPSGSQNTSVEFILDGVDYIIEVGYVTEAGNTVMYAFLISHNDGTKLVISCDCGSEDGKQEFAGTLDGRVDRGQLGRTEDKDFQPYNRYAGQNLWLRDNLQKVHNASLEKIHKFFKQQ